MKKVKAITDRFPKIQAEKTEMTLEDPNKENDQEETNGTEKDESADDNDVDDSSMVTRHNSC